MKSSWLCKVNDKYVGKKLDLLYTTCAYKQLKRSQRKHCFPYPYALSQRVRDRVILEMNYTTSCNNTAHVDAILILPRNIFGSVISF